MYAFGMLVLDELGFKFIDFTIIEKPLMGIDEPYDNLGIKIETEYL